MSQPAVVRAIRGAIKVESNDSDAIRRRVVELVDTFFERNSIHASMVVSIIFSQTRDLTAMNPATALRSRGYDDIPLFCTQEPDYEGAMERMIRILVTCRMKDDATSVPVYLNGAEKLRADLFG